jgi:hypothetical protein
MEGFAKKKLAQAVTVSAYKDFKNIDETARQVLEALVNIDEAHRKLTFRVGSLFEHESAELTRNFVASRHLAALQKVWARSPSQWAPCDQQLLIIAVDEADKCSVPLAHLVRTITSDLSSPRGSASSLRRTPPEARVLRNSTLFSKEEYPMRYIQFALLSVVLVLAGQSVVAATYTVGAQPSDCTHTPNFSSIQTAVTSVPAGSIIEVCPDTYAEQITISQPLTLRGISVNNSKQVIITVPSGGLATTSSIATGTEMAAQIEVTAGPVNITGITVDGTAGSCPTSELVGIFYSSGSSGTVDEVETRNQGCNGFGNGIIVENGAGTAQSVTIENSIVNNFNNYGIVACSNQTPTTLTALIRNNYIAANAPASDGVLTTCNANAGGEVTTVAGSVSGNFIAIPAAATTGVFASSPSSAISNNTITGVTYGIYVVAPTTVTANHVSNIGLGAGIFLAQPGATVTTNTITQAGIGIEFLCNSETASGNIINGATTGINSVPAAFRGVNSFYNVATVTGGC